MGQLGKQPRVRVTPGQSGGPKKTDYYAVYKTPLSILVLNQNGRLANLV